MISGHDAVGILCAYGLLATVLLFLVMTAVRFAIVTWWTCKIEYFRVLGKIANEKPCGKLIPPQGGSATAPPFKNRSDARSAGPDGHKY